jgi:polyphenol oxidase
MRSPSAAQVISTSDQGPVASPAPFTFGLLARADGLRHGITRRAPALHRDGDMSFVTGGDVAAVFTTRRAWAARIGIDAAAVVAARQVHGADVTEVGAADRGRGARAIDDAIPASDALITDAPGVPLLVCVADCAPILLHDPVRRAIGLVHAGWRGTVADVAGAAVRALGARYGTDPADVAAGIGPAIGACCYVVGRDVVEAWAALEIDDGEVIRPVEGQPAQWRFDLPRANRLLLVRAGVPAAGIEDAATCTACHVDEYFSHRAEQGRAGRFGALIMLDG